MSHVVQSHAAKVQLLLNRGAAIDAVNQLENFGFSLKQCISESCFPVSYLC
jgi:hypothetical protein